MGIIDEIVDPDNVNARAMELAESEGVKVQGGSWGSIKVSAWEIG
jgi:hypothetical protein